MAHESALKLLSPQINLLEKAFLEGYAQGESKVECKSKEERLSSRSRAGQGTECWS